MDIRAKLARPIALFVFNHFFAGTHFFGLKRGLLRMAGMKVGSTSRLVGPLRIGSVARLEVGEGCWIGKNLLVDGNGSVVIGDNVDIGPQVTFSTGGHEIGEADRRAGKGVVSSQSVGKGTWIGTHVVIIGETRIGAGCVVAGGSVVTKSCGDNTLVAGVPAVEKKELP